VRRTGFSVLPLVISLTLLTGCHPMKESQTVVYASFSEAVSASPLARQEADRLAAVKKVLDEGAQQAMANYAGMPADKAAQARQADSQLLNAQWAAEQQGARSVVLAEVRKAAEALLKKEGYALIVDRDAVMAGAPEKDVTSALVAGLKDAKPDFGSLPAVTPVNPEKG